MKTYHRAPVSDNNTILRTIGKWHKILSAAEVEVTALMVEDDSGNPALEENGAIVAATIKLQSPIYRALGAGDALMIIDAAAWYRMLESEREALVDQQLTRIGVLREKAEKTDPDFVGWDHEADAADAPIKRDSKDKAKLRLRPYDYSIFGFRSVVERHKMNSPEAISARQCQDESGQYVWEWSAVLVEEKVNAAKGSFQK